MDKASGVCKVENHKLIKSCGPQRAPHGPKKICSKGKCQRVLKKVSDGGNLYGDVYILKDNSVAKVNKTRVKGVNVSNEIRIQMLASKHGLAPKIYEYYKGIDNKYYIIMENLLTEGYDTFKNVFRDHVVPMSAIMELKKKIKMLHELGISHKDLHPNNVFYNKELNKIYFIDFGLSRLYKGPDKRNLAVLNEKWEKFRFFNIFNGPFDKAKFYYVKLGINYGLHAWFIEEYGLTNDILTYCKKNIKILKKIKRSGSLDLSSNINDILVYHNTIRT